MRRISLALLAATAGLAGLAPAAQADVRVGANFPMNSDSSPFRAQDRLGLAVDPANPQHVVAVNGNFRTVQCEASTSFDGGETWSPPVPLPFPAPGINQGAFVPSCGLNQSVEFGSGQNVYTTATAQRQGAGFLQDNGILVFKSTNGGASWQAGVEAIAGGPGSAGPPTPTSPGPSFQRPSVAVDPGRGTSGDRVYVHGQDFVTRRLRAAVSNDGGQTFSAPFEAAPGVDTTEPAKPLVNADHSISVVYRTIGATGLLQAAKLPDGGQTFGAPVDIARVTNNGTSTATHVPTAPGVTAQSSTTASYPRVARDPTSGAIYVVYHQGSTGPTEPTGGFQGSDHFINPDGAVYFQRSRNQGATWSMPKLISDRTQYPGSRLVQTRHPNISVSPSGRINIVWHDRRHWYQERGERTCSHSHIFCEDVRLGDTYYSHSTDGGDTFSPNLRISDRSMNDDVGLDESPLSGYWNYAPQSVTVGGGRVLLGWMDSRQGNWDTGTEDIYFSKVDFEASGAVPQETVDQPDAIARSVALSKLGYQGGNQGALTGGTRDPAGPFPAGQSGGVAARNASAVVIANENDVAGALAGGVLARANPAPVLLSPAGGLPASVQAEVSRLGPERAFVIGDAAKLSEQVVADLAAAGIPAARVTRLSGANDAATAVAVATRMDQRFPAERSAGMPAFDAVVIANPAGPDAAAASALAAARRLPILYVGRDAVPDETAQALSTFNIDKTLVIGGPGQVSDAALSGFPSVTRLGGADQFATSKAVAAESAARGLPSNVVYAADGTKPMDAALLGSAVARTTGIMLLSQAPLFDTAPGTASAAGLSRIDQFVLLGPPRPTTPVQTPTPAPTYVIPTPTPTVTPPPPGRKKPGLSATVRPKRDRKKPFRFTTRGTLKRPGGVSKAAGCKGKARITVKRRGSGKTLSSRLATVKNTCKFTSKVTFKNSRRFGKTRKARRRGTLVFTIRFQGNARLTPRSIKRTARYG